MCQSFRESISKFNNLGDFCFAGFNDNALTYLSGLNPRLAPVALIQWFGEKMMFEVSKRNFGYKESIFINKTIYLSTSRIGTFKSEDGGLGPVDCGSISRDKKSQL